jgi:hypothetical protein
MKNLIGFFIASLIIISLTLGVPTLSIVALNYLFGPKIALGVVITVVSVIITDIIFWKSLTTYINNLFANRTNPDISGLILTNENIATLEILNTDLTLEQYTDRVTFFHNDHSRDGVEALKNYFRSRIPNTSINYSDSPLPLMLKLLELVDSNLPASTMEVLHGKDCEHTQKDDEFDGLDLSKAFEN